MQTIADVGETQLLERIRRRLGGSFSGVLQGIGDDAALLTSVGPTAVFTTDMLVAEVDFRRCWASAQDIGHKAAAASISDLAAMGAQPRALLASVALQSSEHVEDVMDMLERLHQVGQHFGAPLVGGDLSRIEGPLVISVTAIGSLSAGQALKRGGGQLGDMVLVSGTLGGASAGLHLLEQGLCQPSDLIQRQLRPWPQVILGQQIAATGVVHACADISDGLAKDALHLVPNAYGIELHADRLPTSPGLRTWAQAQGYLPEQLALTGGEDFELVMAVAPAHVPMLEKLAQSLGTCITPVGQVVDRPGLHVHGLDSPYPPSFEHFR